MMTPLLTAPRGKSHSSECVSEISFKSYGYVFPGCIMWGSCKKSCNIRANSMDVRILSLLSLPKQDYSLRTLASVIVSGSLFYVWLVLLSSVLLSFCSCMISNLTMFRNVSNT